MFLIIAVVLIALVLGYNLLFDRRQAAANASGWAPLAPLVAGQVKGNGVRGTYLGRPVTVLIDTVTTGGPQSADADTSSWKYILTLGPTGTPSGQSWSVDFTGAGPRNGVGDEAIWRQVLVGVDAQERSATGFDHCAYHARKGELSCTFNLLTVTLGTDLKDLAAAAKSPPPPSPEVFMARLDMLTRLADINQSVNQST